MTGGSRSMDHGRRRERRITGLVVHVEEKPKTRGEAVESMLKDACRERSSRGGWPQEARRISRGSH
jgi:hypothetical protein